MAVKIAIWGAGKMGQLHGHAYESMEGVEIACIIEKDPEKAEAFSEEFHCKSVGKIEEADTEDWDGIDICLPTWLHREAIEKAVGRCRGIFCEKPICLDGQEYAVIRQAMGKSRSFVMVGQVLRFWSGYVRVKELLEEGKIGSPRLITCRRRQKMPDWSMGGWLKDSRRSGGILMDLSIHDVDYIYWILGMPKTVACEIVKRDETTLHNLITLTYDGCCASITGSWGMPAAFYGGGLEYYLEIVGDRGMLEYQGGAEVKLVTDCGTEGFLLKEEDGYLRELMYFVDCIRKDAEPDSCSVDSVEGTMNILWAAKRAAAQGRIVSLEEMDSRI